MFSEIEWKSAKGPNLGAFSPHRRIDKAEKPLTDAELEELLATDPDELDRIDPEKFGITLAPDCEFSAGFLFADDEPVSAPMRTVEPNLYAPENN
jgi:hypothetical protein